MRDQKELAMKCQEIEENGGSVTDFLKGLGFISAKATWERLQLNELGRKYDPYTGSFTTEGRKGFVKKLTLEVKKKAVQIAIDGMDPRIYLGRECNIKDPATAWWKIRQDLKDKDPAMYKKLPKRLNNKDGWKAHNDVFHNPTPKVDKGMPKQLVLEGGQNYEPSVAETPEDPKAEEPAPKGGDYEALKFGGCEVTAVREKEFDLGEFYRDHKHDCIDWRTPGGDEISMTPDAWRNLVKKIPEVLGVLGVQV